MENEARENGEQVLNPCEAADYLNLDEQALREFADTDQIPAFKIGGSWRFRKTALDSWADKRRSAAALCDILVVDDDPAILAVIRMLLRKEGFLVRTAQSGAEALNLFSESVPDIIVLDLIMPGMNGAEVVKKLRARDPDLPIVMLTGYPESELVTRACAYEPFTLFEKPIDPERLLATVRDIAARSRPRV